jgi:hypothetical protein
LEIKKINIFATKFNQMKKILLLFLVCFLNNQEIFSQTIEQEVEKDTSTYVVLRNNGIELIGKILSDDGREVLIETKTLGKIYIPKSEIKSITLLDFKRVLVSGEYREKGAFTTRYQFSTNAFPIDKGENYAMINLYGPEVHFAVSDRLSVGVMATWIASPIALALKYTIPTSNEKLNFGFGTLLGSSGYIYQAKGFGGLHWAMMSYGDRLNNITISVGYSYLRTGQEYCFPEPGVYPFYYDEWTSQYYPSYVYENVCSRKYSPRFKAPIIGIAGIKSVGKKASFIFDGILLIGNTSRYGANSLIDYENQITVVSDIDIVYTQPSLNFVLMPGMRFQKTDKRAFQIALAGVIGSTKYQGNNFKSNYSFPLPMASWFFKF